MDVVVIRIGRVIDCTNGKKPSVELISLDVELLQAVNEQHGFKKQACTSEDVGIAQFVRSKVPRVQHADQFGALVVRELGGQSAKI